MTMNKTERAERDAMLDEIARLKAWRRTGAERDARAATLLQQAARVDGVRFIAWMIDNCEGCRVTEEDLQAWLADFLRSEAALSAQPAPPTYTHGADGSVMQDNSGDPGYWTTQPAPERQGAMYGALERSLRNRMEEDGMHGSYPDKLCIEAADAIANLRIALASQIDITNTERGYAERAAKRLSAAPVGVPDGWRSIIEEAIAVIGDVQMFKGNLKIGTYRHVAEKLRLLLAAAPSAPQGTQQGEG